MTGSLQIKNGKYFAVLNFRDQHGKRVQKWFSLGLDVKGNKRRAETMLNELLVQYQGIENIEPMNTLLSRHIASWIEMDKPNISVTTYNQYVNILNLHIAPYFDPRKITVSSVTAGDMEDCYTFTQCFSSHHRCFIFRQQHCTCVCLHAPMTIAP